jgi:hypothetical protein
MAGRESRIPNSNMDLKKGYRGEAEAGRGVPVRPGLRSGSRFN